MIRIDLRNRIGILALRDPYYDVTCLPPIINWTALT